MHSFEFCLATKGIAVPDGPGWLVKYNCYRLRLEREGDRARVMTRDGEAVVLGVNGISDFNAPLKHDQEVQFCAFGKPFSSLT